MSITINLNPELEARLRKRAEKEGLNLNKYVAQFLEGQFLKKTKNVLPEKEASLLQKINSGFPIDFWTKYKALIKKREDEVINTSELQELIEMTDQLEIANAARIKHLIELSELRNVSLEDLMKELGIQPVVHG